ncbi:hypothetical protein [Streptomyces genisteinicus]|uniref:DUF2269 family protein n=1 Tax=Streptomyces genisteinicus TaxID=2768068 RepID=A0A7H0HXY0_9ACTN|nr:hypothetical protein [Streptomyces genisteinicus]QNP65396.1 hypothetical protein IAG43_22350 [Streptomyces genisteinicus]
MTKFLLSVHVLAAILAIGPVAVAASLFPRAVKETAGDPARSGADGGQPPLGGWVTAAFLHRICRVYAVVGVSVPVFGIATGAQLGVLTDAWLLVSLLLTTAAAVVLGALILPGQERLLATADTAGTPAAGTPGAGAPRTPGPRAAAARLAMLTGIFNLLWAVVVVLMIVRPGSTTSA